MEVIISLNVQLTVCSLMALLSVLSSIHNSNLCRKKSLTAKGDFVVASNMAYREVSLKPREVEGEYEIPDAILKPSESGQVTEIMATTNMYEAVDTINPAAPEYATTDEAVHGITHCSS